MSPQSRSTSHRNIRLLMLFSLSRSQVALPMETAPVRREGETVRLVASLTRRSSVREHSGLCRFDSCRVGVGGATTDNHACPGDLRARQRLEYRAGTCSY